MINLAPPNQYLKKNANSHPNKIIWSLYFRTFSLQNQIYSKGYRALADRPSDGWTYYSLSKQEGQVTH